MRVIFSIVIMLNFMSSFSQSNGTILSRSEVSYPEYNAVKGISVYYSREIYQKAISNKKVRTEKLNYWSDGLKVIAYLSTPVKMQHKKYPIIVFNRGSFIRDDIAYVHAPLFQKFVDSGFIVIAPALRQSEGGEGKDEMGGADLNDIFNVLPLLASLPFADTSNIFVYGESRGGVMSLQISKRLFPANAIATVGAFTDFELFIKENPALEKVSGQIWNDFEVNRKSITESRSALLWAEKINAPLLIMQGSNDRSVSPMHGLRLAQRLELLQKDYQLMILNQGNHVLSGKWTNERDRQIIRWFKNHIK
jgi:dipeptidyl aminopeptidase/acylaminoacyl peptidase